MARDQEPPILLHSSTQSIRPWPQPKLLAMASPALCLLMATCVFLTLHDTSGARPWTILRTTLPKGHPPTHAPSHGPLVKGPPHVPSIPTPQHGYPRTPPNPPSHALTPLSHALSPPSHALNPPSHPLTPISHALTPPSHAAPPQNQASGLPSKEGTVPLVASPLTTKEIQREGEYIEPSWSTIGMPWWAVMMVGGLFSMALAMKWPLWPHPNGSLKDESQPLNVRPAMLSINFSNETSELERRMLKAELFTLIEASGVMSGTASEEDDKAIDAILERLISLNPTKMGLESTTTQELASGDWMVIHAPHIKRLSKIFGTNFHPIHYLIAANNTIHSHVQYKSRFPLSKYSAIEFEGWLSAAGTVGSKGSEPWDLNPEKDGGQDTTEGTSWTSVANFDTFWWDAGSDLQDSRQGAEMSTIDRIVQAVGKLASIPNFCIFPVAYLDDDLCVFSFPPLDVKITAKKQGIPRYSMMNVEGLSLEDEPLLSRRGLGVGVLTATLANKFGGADVARAATTERLLPGSDYIARVCAARSGLIAIKETLSMMAEGNPDLVPPSAYAELRRRLHKGALGQFWINARGLDRYVEASDPGLRGALAREEPDMFALLPEKAGPLAHPLQPDWDDPDDKLCLVYACVNDPGAPVSITTLYALKLLDVGFRFGAEGNTKVTPAGLLNNVGDADTKMEEYIITSSKALAMLDPALLDERGVLIGVDPPPRKAFNFGPTPLG